MVDASRQVFAARGLADLVCLVQPVLDRFRDYKRSTALLDFDDLIFAAPDLLRDHEAVRRALAGRFAHVLVGDFQATDPLQFQLFWLLSVVPPPCPPAAAWQSLRFRSCALFPLLDLTPSLSPFP